MAHMTSSSINKIFKEDKKYVNSSVIQNQPHKSGTIKWGMG